MSVHQPVTNSEVPQSDSGAAKFPIRVEIVRQLKRRRTMVIFGLLVALPVVVLIALQIGDPSSGGGGSEQGGYMSPLDVAKESGANFTAAMLFLSAGFFLVIPIALFFGDSIASEASWSTLRYLLAAPVPRTRLLLVKIAVAFLFSFFAIVLLASVSLLLGTLVYGTGPLSLPTSAPLSFGAAIGRFAMVTVFILISQLTTAGLALWLSTRTDAPLGAVGGAMGLQIIGSILDQVTALGSLRELLPAHWDYAWYDLLQPTINWTGMAKGAAVSFSFGLLLFAWAIRRFGSKDVVS
ncbi:ABC transporter permease [Yimella sp. cx-573]|nr:ABC transporter permease [Yimella sp. cx-573]